MAVNNLTLLFVILRLHLNELRLLYQVFEVQTCRVL